MFFVVGLFKITGDGLVCVYPKITVFKIRHSGLDPDHRATCAEFHRSKRSSL